MKNIGIIFAGGVGSRMRTKTKPKQFLNVFNKPIIIYTLEYFEQNSNIDYIVVSCIKEWIPYLYELIQKYQLKKIIKIVQGGKSGQLSIYNGLKAAKEIVNGENAIVLIHDGVRPLINSELISKNIETVKLYGSSITVGIVKETIVVVDGKGGIKEVPSRKNSRVAKAPQSFYLDDILLAHERAIKAGIQDAIDSCTLMQKFGYELHMLDGPYENIKITTPEDFFTMRAILDAKENAQIYGLDE